MATLKIIETISTGILRYCRGINKRFNAAVISMGEVVDIRIWPAIMMIARRSTALAPCMRPVRERKNPP